MSDEWPDRPSYPQQQLGEQHVEPGRSRRRGLIAGVTALVLAIASGAVVWAVVAAGDDADRDAYCAALARATGDGDLMGVLVSADEGTVDAFQEAGDLAPDAVADDWAVLESVIEDPGAIAEDGEFGQAAELLTALQSIASDAEDACGLDLNLPFQ